MKRTFCLFLVVSMLMVGCSSAGSNVTPTPESGRTIIFEPIISTTGIVVPAQWAALSTRGQGVVSEVLVAEGQQVSSGQVLLRLDGQAAAQANLRAAQLELINAQQALDSLNEDSAAETALAQQEVANAMQALDDARKDVNKLEYRRASDDLLKQTQDEIDLAKKQVSRAEDAFKRFKDRPEGDSLRAEAELALVKARLYLNDRVSLLNWYLGKPDDIDSAKYLAALAVAETNLAHARLEYERRKAGPDTNLLSQASARLALAKAQVQAAEETLDALELQAPFAGVICNLDARVGEWVMPGMTLMHLGDLDELRVQTTDLSEIDAARVHSQDTVSVSFDALPDVIVQGRVLQVANKSAATSGVNYTAVIELESIPEGLRWGMTTFADIKVTP